MKLSLSQVKEWRTICAPLFRADEYCLETAVIRNAQTTSVSINGDTISILGKIDHQFLASFSDRFLIHVDTLLAIRHQSGNPPCAGEEKAIDSESDQDRNADKDARHPHMKLQKNTEKITAHGEVASVVPVNRSSR